MHIDHILPETAGGLTIESNLCLACPTCNQSKGATQFAVDPVTDQEVKLFNPRIQNWAEHFQWDKSGIRLLGLTPTARATIEQLNINLTDVVQARTIWVQAGWHPPKKLS